MHKECFGFAVLIGLYKKSGAVSCVGIDFYLIWSLYLVNDHLHDKCGMVVVTPGYPVGLDLIVGR